jgi:opacity protein-like surface antigen
MKKMLLTAAAVSALATSSAYAIENQFYLKANVGGSRLYNYRTNGVVVKSTDCVHFGVGTGYYVMDNARVDLTFDHFVDPTFKKSAIRIKSHIDTLLLNGYLDVLDVDALKVFVGVGAGIGQVEAKTIFPGGTVKGTGAGLGQVKAKIMYKGGITSADKINTLAFAGYVGTSYKFTQGVTSELSYSYRDMGKTKRFGAGAKAAHFRGHHATASIRFDI